MHGAAGIARDELPERAREVARIGGATVLIVHDLQLRSLAREAQDGGDEVRATLPEQPLRANDQVRLRQDIADGLFPRELGPAVHVERTDGVILTVRSGRPSVEHIVVLSCSKRAPVSRAARARFAGPMAFTRCAVSGSASADPPECRRHS